MTTTDDRVDATPVAAPAPTIPADLPRLGRLERVDPRMAWPDEATHFAPWLAQTENLVWLGEMVGLELEVLPPELGGAACRAGVVCRDRRSNVRVLVHAQVEETDHAHLGELIAEVAALSVGQVIWVAENFSDTHRAALDWLNSVTSNTVVWRGVEVQLWRIGASMAPRWNVIVRPPARGPGVHAPVNVDLTALKRDQLAFWSRLRDHLDGVDHGLKVPEARPDYAMRFGIGRSGCQLEAAALFGQEDRLWVAVKLTGPQANQHYQHLLLQREEVEADLETLIDDEPVWDEYPRGEQTSYIYVQCKQPRLADRATWDGHMTWLGQTLEALAKVFRNRIDALPR